MRPFDVIAVVLLVAAVMYCGYQILMSAWELLVEAGMVPKVTIRWRNR